MPPTSAVWSIRGADLGNVGNELHTIGCVDIVPAMTSSSPEFSLPGDFSLNFRAEADAKREIS